MTQITKLTHDFLNCTQVAVISTIDTSGRPHSTPIWYKWNGEYAAMFTGTKTTKWRNLTQFPYASLCVDKREIPYRSTMLQGKVEEIRIPLHDFVLEMATRYYGPKEGKNFAHQYPDDTENVVVFKLTPEKITDIF